MLTLTQKAAQAAKKFQEEMKAGDKSFRIDIVAGGCHGRAYEFGFDEEKLDDVKSVQHGLKVVISPQVANMLDGVIMDYVSELAGQMFVFKNPKAVSSCGCGNSFSM